jgi:hypothetical protein
MGGTETYGAIKATVDRRFHDIPLEIMLLTDGDIWQQGTLFDYVNQQVEQTKGKIRVFPLGIGNGVSHSLIEGLARAGNGFAQAVQLGERLENSVVRMLRGALSPHVTDYTLEVKYAQDDDDFEVVEKVTDGMKVLLVDSEEPSTKPQSEQKPKISLFDPTANPEKDDLKSMEAKVPNIPSPKLLQAPHKIPSLFAFSRTTVYLLMSPETIQRNPTAVVLRATSEQGPLELEIPIEVLSTPDQTIHQLAAKKAVQDLEEGRGWIYDAKDQDGMLVKDKYPSCFDDLVKREAVRLGEKFQIAGKYCSFVAVAANDKENSKGENAGHNAAPPPQGEFSLLLLKSLTYANCVTDLDAQESEYSERFKSFTSPPPQFKAAGSRGRGMGRSAGGFAGGVGSTRGYAMANPQSYQSAAGSLQQMQMQLMFLEQQNKGRLMMARQEQDAMAIPQVSYQLAALPASQQQMGQPWGGYPTASVTRDGMQSNPSTRSAGVNPMSSFGVAPQAAAFAPMSAQPQMSAQHHTRGSSGGWSLTNKLTASIPPSNASSDPYYGRAVLDQGSGHEQYGAKSEAKVDWSSKSAAEKVLELISLQDFEGSWATPAETISDIMSIKIPENPKCGEQKVWLTLLVIAFLEQKMADEEGTWGLVAEKARGWLAGLGLMDLELLEHEASEFMKKQ